MERPTFSEHWHRISRLTARLRSDAQVTRQRAHGERWWVVRDPGTNGFVRISEPAWGFVGLLDGRRTVAEAWERVCERFGDDAPTQTEAIQALAQLYTANLLMSDLPGDARALFERAGKRRKRQVSHGFMGFLFFRVPLFDPNDVLGKWLPIGGLAFTVFGFVVWCVLVLLGVNAIVQDWERFASGVWDVLAFENLALLYVAIGGVKLLHELGHGFACRKFGRVEGTGGEVHTLGVMFLVFVPIPYVDASSAWGLRSKWRRAAIGAAGMYVELAVASVAAMVWAATSSGVVNSIAYNIVFVAGVTTILFNSNPLLRYDGYYILSDLIEIPNMQQRGSRELHHWVKRLVWGVRNSVGVARSGLERGCLLVFACLSGPYRIFVGLVIALFVSQSIPFVGVAIALATLAVFLVVPVAKFLAYLFTSHEIERQRGRALVTTAVVLGMLGVGIAGVPVPRWATIDGVVEPRVQSPVYAREAGFLEWVRVSGERVGEGDALGRLEHSGLLEERASVLGELNEARALYDAALAEDAARAAIVAGRVAALRERLEALDERVRMLEIGAGVDGRWYAPDAEERTGAYIQRGEAMGLVYSEDDFVIRGLVSQNEAGAVLGQFGVEGTLAAEGRSSVMPGQTIRLTLVEAAPAGVRGRRDGFVDVGMRSDGDEGEERRFEVKFELEEDVPLWMRAGMSVEIRVRLDAEPLGVQWSRSLWQLLLRRFGGEV